MIIAQTIDFLAPAINVGVVLGIIWWINRSKVDGKTCDRTHSLLNTELKNIRDYIGDTEKRAEGRHKELKELIKNNGQNKPKVIT